MGAIKYIQAMDTGKIDDEMIIFEVKAARPDQKVTLQLFDYSPETHVENLVIYDSKRSTYVFTLTIICTCIKLDN